MKKALGLGILIAVSFALFVLVNDLVGASAFYMAAIGMAMFAIIGPAGDYFKAAIAVLVGVIVGLVSILALAGAMPLPPDNLIYVALVSGLALFALTMISLLGLRIDAMFIGWGGYFAAVYGTYTVDAAALATQAIPAAVGVSASLLFGLLIAVVLTRVSLVLDQ